METRIVHHTTELKEKCSNCNRPFIMNWYDKDEKSGCSETEYKGPKGLVCFECKTALNNGLPPLSLWDHNEILRRGITKEQYYSEHGYNIPHSHDN